MPSERKQDGQKLGWPFYSFKAISNLARKLKLQATFIGVQAVKAFKHKASKEIQFYLAYIYLLT